MSKKIIKSMEFRSSKSKFYENKKETRGVRAKYTTKNFLNMFIIGMANILIVILFGFIISIGYQNKEVTTIEIQDKWVKNNSKSSDYLISTDKGVYKVSDLFFIGKFNSSDIYAQLEKGKTYKITSTGYRIQFLSLYKNINTLEEER